MVVHSLLTAKDFNIFQNISLKNIFVKTFSSKVWTSYYGTLLKWLLQFQTSANVCFFCSTQTFGEEYIHKYFRDVFSWSYVYNIVCFKQTIPFQIFKGCLSQILLDPFLNTLPHIYITKLQVRISVLCVWEKSFVYYLPVKDYIVMLVNTFNFMFYSCKVFVSSEKVVNEETILMEIIWKKDDFNDMKWRL